MCVRVDSTVRLRTLQAKLEKELEVIIYFSKITRSYPCSIVSKEQCKSTISYLLSSKYASSPRCINASSKTMRSHIVSGILQREGNSNCVISQ